MPFKKKLRKSTTEFAPIKRVGEIDHRLQSSSCEIGRVSPLYGFLEETEPQPEDTNMGYVLTGCSESCEYKIFFFFSLTII